MSRFRKILLITLFIFAVILMAFGLYWFFFRAEPVPEVPEEVAEEGLPPVTGLAPSEVAPKRLAEEELPPGVSATAKGGLTLVSALTKQETLGTELASDGRNLQFYNKEDGKFYRLTPEGSVSELSDKVFFQVENVSWAPNGGKAILEYPDGSNIVYDFDSKKQVTLPRHWQEFDFSPDSSRIVAKSIDSDPLNRWLVSVNTDGTGMQPIELLGKNDDKVDVNYSPNGQVVAFSRTGEEQGFGRQDILLLGLNGENFKALKVNGLNFDAKWSNSGEKLLYNVHNADTDYKPILWVTDASGDNIGTNKRNIGLNTWADKCTFSSETVLYCAVPQTLKRGAGFQPATADSTPDVFYRVDTKTGSKTLIATPSGNYTAENLIVSSDERYLYFTDKQTGLIQKITLR